MLFRWFATQNQSRLKKCRCACLHYKPQMFASHNNRLGSVQTRRYRCVNCCELTGNRFGAKISSVDLSYKTALSNGAFI